MGAEGHLFFATRMADKAPEWFAWAIFSDLRQTLIGRHAHQSLDAPIEPPSPLTSPAEDDEIASPVPVEVRTEYEVNRPETDLDKTDGDPVVGWLGRDKGVAFHLATRGVDCPPPPSGVALKRLPSIAIDEGFQFGASLYTSADGDSFVEFGVAITDLPPANVLAAVNARGGKWDDTRLAFSGWRKATSGSASRLVLAPASLTISSAHIYLMTRLGGKTPGDARIGASFEQVTLGAVAMEHELQ